MLILVLQFVEIFVFVQVSQEFALNIALNFSVFSLKLVVEATNVSLLLFLALEYFFFWIVKMDLHSFV